MLFLIALSFAGVIFTSSSGCDIGALNFNSFDFQKFNGPWVWLYHTKSDQESPFGCLRDNFIPQGDRSISTTVAYNSQEKSNQEFQGFVKESNSNSYFHDFEDNVPAPWKTTFYIMGVDYNQYVVLKGCLVGQNIPYTYAGFRVANPDENALEAANKTLEEYGMSLNDLVKFPNCDL
ncbi:uncharacterized protein [Periplaneta americana]|uniref:uncharacterized protein n=1 Tax=Periplaneta americana TaxID=6978 RepID=UPI0037E8BE65